MTAKTALPPKPTASPETRPASRPPAPPKRTEVARPRVYWGDRLTLWFWICCFVLMLAMNAVDALQRFVLFVMNRPPAP